MKNSRKLLAILMVALMVVSVQLSAMAVELGDKITENIPELKNLTKNNCTALGTSSQTLNSSQMMVENDKYVFVAVGMKGLNFRVCSAVQVFDKKTGELLTTITQATNNAVWYAPLRNMYVEGDILYLGWGNAVNSPAGVALRPLIDGVSVSSPVIAYNVSNVTENSTLSGLVINSGNAYVAADLPYTQGGITYLDEANGVLYASLVGANAATNKIRYYYAYETSGMADAITSGTKPTGKIIFTYGDESINTAEFIIKDNWLVEIVKNKAGMSDYATDTLTGNNQVRVYDLSGVTFTTTAQNVTNKLKGIYTTSVTDDGIRDVEIAGDYMYVATSAGIEVVSLMPAKAQDASASTVLTATNTVTETGVGGTADLDIIGKSLFAAYTGPEYFGATGASSKAGALVVYDIAKTPASPVKSAETTANYGLLEISANADDGVIYALQDVLGPPTMTAYNYVPDVLVDEKFEFTAIKLGDSDKVTAGKFDVKVELSNPDGEKATLLCALYEGNKLSDVLVTETSAAGEITIAQDYEVEGKITEIKAMFFKNTTNDFRPLIPAISIGK